MNLAVKLPVYAGIAICCVIVGVPLWVKWQYYVPSQQKVLDRFQAHRSEFVRFATLLQHDRFPCYVSSSGRVWFGSEPSRYVAEYRKFAHAVGVKFATVGEDGVVEFALWGFGGTLLDDRYEGVCCYPGARHEGKGVTTVSSLDTVPRQNGDVVPGYYVVPIEPGWELYRFEYIE